MKKIWILISIIVIIIGCTKTSYEDVISCESLNWTSDGKVIFIREKEVWKTVEDIGVRSEIVSDSTWLYEINADGSGRENKGLLFDDTSFGGAGLSSAGDWVVCGDADTNIWVVGRDGTGLQEIGEGRNPDFSPDASQIVYEKPNNGIWIMDRDGDNDHQIISDADARYPAWSPDDTLIAYNIGDLLYIMKIQSSTIDSIRRNLYISDWLPEGLNSIVAWDWRIDRSILIDLENFEEDTLGVQINKVSPSGESIIGYDEGGGFISKFDYTNKWYIQP